MRRHRQIGRLDRPAMCFDDRSAHRQPDAHAAGLGREEALEQPRELLGRDARASIGDLDARRSGSWSVVRMVRRRSSRPSIACTALIAMLAITCCSCTRSARMSGRSDSSSSTVAMDWRRSSGPRTPGRHPRPRSAAEFLPHLVPHRHRANAVDDVGGALGVADRAL